MNSAKPIKFYGSVYEPAVKGKPALLIGLDDTKWMMTSEVVDVGNDGKTIETRNTIYKLMEG